MNAADIGLTGLAASSILIAVGVAISMWRHLGLEGQLLWAALRALVQLLIVGFALQLVIDNENSLVYSLIWLAVMQLFASYTTWRRAPEVSSVFLLALIAYSASMIVTLGVCLDFRCTSSKAALSSR